MSQRLISLRRRSAARFAVALLGASLLLAACSREAPESTEAEEAAADVPAGEAVAPGTVPEVVVLSGLDEVVGWLEAEDWWGEPRADEPLSVPRIIITGISPNWKDASAALPVQTKKALFYRLMGPLVLHANEMARTRRDRLLAVREVFGRDGAVSNEQMAQLREAAWVLPDEQEALMLSVAADAPVLGELLDEMIYRVDEVPAGLALGQAAYESGYATSRFAVDGNALFGQWTWGGDGMVPGQQRSAHGDHRIAAFEWPFDSVRGYFINLMTHRAYEDFRRLRAEARAEGRALSSLELADGLLSYSERGQAYVDTLKGMIRHNGLVVADDAVFRDEPMRFLVFEADPERAARMRKEIAAMRKSGELAEIFERMRLE